MSSQTEAARQHYLTEVKAKRDLYHEKIGQYENVWAEASEPFAKAYLAGQIHLCQRILKIPLTDKRELLALPLLELSAKADALGWELGSRIKREREST